MKHMFSALTKAHNLVMEIEKEIRIWVLRAIYNQQIFTEYLLCLGYISE